jgi:phosphotransferase system HPr (HPr) family protein
MSASSEQAAADQTAEEHVVLSADLHARPAGQVTRAATGLDARVWLQVGDRPEVDARSVLAVMGLGAVAGDTVRVRGVGDQAPQAVTAVAAVLAAAEAVPAG